MKSRFLVIPAVAALATALIGCKSGGGNTIKVGEFASLTGKEATFGTSSHEGTELAIEEINKAGGVLGKQIELLTEDNQSKAGEPANIVNKLISRDGVVAVLGEVASSRSLEAAPISQTAKIPMISPASTNPKVTEVGDYIFRVCFIDPFQGTVMANFATKTLKAKKVAVLTDAKSDYSKGLAKYFKEGFTAAGGTIAIALCLGRLAARTTRSGGMQIFVQDAFGKLPGFLVGWSNWVACVISTAAMAVGFVGYLTAIVPGLSNEPGYQAVVALAVIWTVTLVLLRGVNDDPESLGALMRAMVETRIKPYYLHHPDLAPGTGPCAGNGVASLDDGRNDVVHFHFIVVSTDGVDHCGVFLVFFAQLFNTFHPVFIRQR